MLQLPEARRSSLVQHFSAKAQSLKRAVTKVETAIADHKRAMRIANNRERDLKALHDKHLEFADCRPSVHFWTRQNGKKCFGRGLADYNAIFPPSLDHISAGNVTGRKRFLAQLEVARPAHKRRRRELGILDAESAAHKATMEEWRAFGHLIKAKPRTSAEVQRFAKYVLLAIERRNGGRFHNVYSRHVEEMGGLEVYDRRIQTTHTDLARLLFALARK